MKITDAVDRPSSTTDWPEAQKWIQDLMRVAGQDQMVYDIIKAYHEQIAQANQRFAMPWEVDRQMAMAAMYRAEGLLTAIHALWMHLCFEGKL